MATQTIDYQLGLDTGDDNPGSIQPVLDGEDANQATFQRPSESLRTRTEILRRTVQDSLYLQDADRSLLLSGGGTIHWNGSPAAGGDGTFVISADLALRPFLAPAATSPAFINLNGVDLVATTIPTSGVNPARAYGQLGNESHPGANQITAEVVAVPGAANIAARVSSPPGPLHVAISANPNTHTLQNLIDFLAGDDPGAVSVRALGFTTRLHAGAQGASLITPVARAFLSGAADAELHLVSPLALATFFAGGDNAMLEGDVLAIWYDALVSASGGGRRQSLAEAPENSAHVPATSLFLVRLHPERIPGALPLARVVDGDLILANHDRYVQGVDGPSVTLSAIDLPASGHVQVGTLSDAGVRLDTAGGQGQLTLSRASSPPAVLKQDSLALLVGGLTNADSLHSHSARAITTAPGPGLAGTNVQDNLAELETQVSGRAPLVHTHVPADIVGDFPAGRVATTPTGNLSAANVQAAIDELDTEKAGLSLPNTFTVQQAMPAGITGLPEPNGPSEPATKGYADAADAKVLSTAIGAVNGLPGQALTWTAAQLFEAGMTVSALATFAQLVANGDLHLNANLLLDANGIQTIAKSGDGTFVISAARSDIYINTSSTTRWCFTMSGQLVSPGGAITGLPAPTQQSDAATKSYVDALPGRAQAWTADQTFDGTHKITGLPTPTASADAVPKSYVDARRAFTMPLTISGTNTGVTVSPANNDHWPNNFKLFYNWVAFTGNPATGAFSVRTITKNQNQFNITLMAAPGAGNSITYDIAIMP